MPKTICHCCRNDHLWSCEEAFDKFGFNDGDGQVETELVEAVLSKAGYAVESSPWGLHNTVIVSIKLNGQELMPPDDKAFEVSYDNPRHYLPEAVIDLLDLKLADRE